MDLIEKNEEQDSDEINHDFQDSDFINRIGNTIPATIQEKMTPYELSSLRKQIQESGSIPVKEKLKIVIPLLFFRYEIEIENRHEQPIPTRWKDWKKLFIIEE